MSRYAGRLPRNYSEAEAALNGRSTRTLLGNTTINRGLDGIISIAYHGNTIAAFGPGGVRSFTNAGWGTVSTRERLNAMTPPGIGFVQRKGRQLVVIDGDEHPGDGVLIGPAGSTQVY